MTRATSACAGGAANAAGERAAKPSSLACLGAEPRCTRKSSRIAQKKTLQAIISGKIDVAAMVNTYGWRGDDSLVNVGFDNHFHVHHG